MAQICSLPPPQPPPFSPPQKNRLIEDSRIVSPYLSLYSYFFFPHKSLQPSTLHFTLACSSWGCSGQGVLRVRYMMKIPTQEGEFNYAIFGMSFLISLSSPVSLRIYLSVGLPHSSSVMSLVSRCAETCKSHVTSYKFCHIFHT